MFFQTKANPIPEFGDTRRGEIDKRGCPIDKYYLDDDRALKM